ncbi:kinesin [Thraustotheca clavata]|uniref:Kinesin n=1 Tax=Thraustotheca clavata TaxID=74557 RepID=A0A1V9ZRP1_9STRA|nr:kinesin [Thraustotheca clavata]
MDLVLYAIVYVCDEENRFGSRISQQIFPVTEGKHEKNTSYTFDKVFPPEATGGQVYEGTARSVVEDFLLGYNGLVCCYGQSQSGKSLTIASICIHVLQDIFVHIRQHAATMQYLVRLAYLEVHNESIIDLVGNKSASISLTMDLIGNFILQGHTNEPILSADHALSCIEAGRTKIIGKNGTSHTILRITMERERKNSNSPIHVAMLDIVDLAASHRVTVPPIDKSLLAFGHIIWQLSHHRTTALPYHDSILTQILQPTLTPSASLGLICTAAPSIESVGETHQTLKFASRAKRVRLELSLPVHHGSIQLEIYHRHLDALLSQRHSSDSIDNQIKLELAIRNLRQVILNLSE